MLSLRKEIEVAINRNCAEGPSNTPDFILAEFLTDCLAAFDKTQKRRAEWYGHMDSIGGPVEYNTAVVPGQPAQPSAPAKKCPECDGAGNVHDSFLHAGGGFDYVRCSRGCPCTLHHPDQHGICILCGKPAQRKEAGDGGK